MPVIECRKVHCLIQVSRYKKNTGKEVQTYHIHLKEEPQ